MQNIHVVRYGSPKETGWAGYIEPEDQTWIAFIDLEGRPKFYLHREPETGAVLPDDPVEREEMLARVRGEQARRAAWQGPVEGVTYPSFCGEVFKGEPLPSPTLAKPPSC